MDCNSDAPSYLTPIFYLQYEGRKSGKIKEYQLSADYCAFMVANVLARYDSTVISSSIQWTSGELSEKMNKEIIHTSATTADLYIDPIALSHGLSLFQKQLNKMGLDAIIVSTFSKSVPDFFGLAGAQRSIEIKFSTYVNNRSENESFLGLIDRMVIIRDSFFLKNNYEKSPHKSPSSVYGNLFLPVMKSMLKKNNSVNKKRVVRKSPSKLRQKAINLSTSKLVKSLEGEFGEKHSLFYLESALKIASKRKIKHDEKISNSTENENENGSGDESDNEECKEEKEMINDNFENDEKIIKATADLPKKYVVFGDEDRSNVLKLFGVVREIALDREYKEVQHASALATAGLLSEIPYYSQISERTIRRWDTLRNQNRKRPGRKVSELFESEVWGNLVMCAFEQNDDDVSN